MTKASQNASRYYCKLCKTGCAAQLVWALNPERRTGGTLLSDRMSEYHEAQSVDEPSRKIRALNS